MKNLFSFLLLISFTFFGHAEDVPMEKAIKWSYKVELTGSDEANLVFTANLFHHFHLFSLKHDVAAYDFTGTPTSIDFTPNSSYKLIGKVRESKPVAGSDEIGNYIWHENKAVFTQKIKILDKKAFDLAFTISWQICNDVMCHMPQVDKKKIQVSPNSNSTGVIENVKEEKQTANTEIEEEKTTVASTTKSIRGTCEKAEEAEEMPVSIGVRGRMIDSAQYEIIYVLKGDENWKTFSGKNGLFKNLVLKINKQDGVSLDGDIQYPETKTYFDSIYKKEIAYYPVGSKFIQKIKVPHGQQPVIKGYVQFNSVSSEEYITSENIEYTYNLINAKKDVQEDGESRSYWGLFIIAFLAGFTALLTPCVFPMIPMTVSFFLKQSKDRKTGIKNAMIYGLSIIVIYITLGLGVTIAFGSDALNAMSTNVYFNVIFFLLLLVFGASFLGAFEIKMPSSWVNKADSKADKGGLIGIFFMAFTLSLVSFSCTGPIIGTLLVSTSDGLMGPFIGMLGFSLALALPFTLFAIFPGMLNQMPQSGGWLNSVKVVLGFLEVALAFKFLSNADLVVQAHLLEREVFLAFWVVIFLLLGLYLLGKLKFSHDSDVPFISVGRLFMSITVFAFVMYMIPGLWGSPLKILSGFLPPQNYSEIPYGIGGSAPKHVLPEHAHHGPHGIPVFHDYAYAKAHADAINKPLMIDFTGHACINCRKMEDQVWSQDFVKELLIDSVVVVSLHVDEKLSLDPKDYIKDENGKTLKSVGEKWSYMQRTRFGQQTQPQYILLDKEEQKLSPSTTYSTDSDKIENFKKWLDDGIEEYYARLNLQTVKGSLMIKPKTCVSPTNTQTYGSMFEEVYGEKYAF